MKIPFDIKYRPEIESGKYKVQTRDGRTVRIICWDRKGDDCPIIALLNNTVQEDFYDYFDDGRTTPTLDCGSDLFIITPEPELTSWQTFISGCLQKYGLLDCGAADRIAKECSAELLDLAEREIVNRVAKECYKEDFCIEDTVKFNEGYKLGKEVALKDLPRWNNSRWIYEDGWIQNGFLYYKNHSIPLKDLEKLPGFNE